MFILIHNNIHYIYNVFESILNYTLIYCKLMLYNLINIVFEYLLTIFNNLASLVLMDLFMEITVVV